MTMYLLTIITVCLNDRNALLKTIKSFLSQDIYIHNKELLEQIEYLIIDGGSNDGTIELIKSYQRLYPHLFRYISEKDSGIYDAMNKGLRTANGKWIQFLNAGDAYADNGVLSYVWSTLCENDSDVIYGDTILVFNDKYERYAPSIPKMQCTMGFIHQAAFFKRTMHLIYPYDLKYKFASDNNTVIGMCLDKKTFYRIAYPICRYDCSGVSFQRSNEYLKEVKQIQIDRGISTERSVATFHAYLLSRIKALVFMRFPSLRWRIIKLKHHFFNPEEEELYAKYKARFENQKCITQ